MKSDGIHTKGIGWSVFQNSSRTLTQLDRALQHAIHRNFHGIIVLLLDSFDMP